MSKEEKEQTSQRKPLLVTMPEAGALVWKPFPAPPEVVLQKKFMLQKNLCWFCQHKVTMITNKTKQKI